MNLWLLDASVLLASEDPDDVNHGEARELLEGEDRLATLDLAFYEVTNVAIRSWRDRLAARRLHERIVAVPTMVDSFEWMRRSSLMRQPSPKSTAFRRTTLHTLRQLELRTVNS